jgi:hypothetical protein
LFSHEAVHSLDGERRRMFVAMKREVLRLRGYEQQCFLSQTLAERQRQIEARAGRPSTMLRNDDASFL